MDYLLLILLFIWLAGGYADMRREQRRHVRHIDDINAEMYRFNGIDPDRPIPRPPPGPLVKYKWQVLVVPYALVLVLVALGFIEMVIYYS